MGVPCASCATMFHGVASCVVPCAVHLIGQLDANVGLVSCVSMPSLSSSSVLRCKRKLE